CLPNPASPCQARVTHERSPGERSPCERSPGEWPAWMPGTLALEGEGRLERQVVAMARGDDLRAHREPGAGETDAHRRRPMPGQMEGDGEGPDVRPRLRPSLGLGGIRPRGEIGIERYRRRHQQIEPVELLGAPGVQVCTQGRELAPLLLADRCCHPE